DLGAVVADHADLRHADALVDPGFGCAVYRNDRSLLCGVCPIHPRRREKKMPGRVSPSKKPRPASCRLQIVTWTGRICHDPFAGLGGPRRVRSAELLLGLR